jgi:UPF0755 protein
MITGKRKYFLAIPLFIVAVTALVLYRVVFGFNIRPIGDKASIYITRKATYSQVMDSLQKHLEIRNTRLLDYIARKKKYPGSIKSGRYLVDRPLSYNDLINTLKSGRQSPVKVTFSNVRTLRELAGKLSMQIDSDSAEILNFLSDQSNYTGDGFNAETIISVFIPDTYELYWNTGPVRLYSRMLEEYNKFWNSSRLEKSREIGLTQSEVSTLASIIDFEAMKSEEKPRIAGVYLNRLRRGIPLQADPTIKFALNDFTLNRILYDYLKVDSPYNTYKYKGLPPGPIGCATIESIDAVLNAEKNDYLYFAARADFSGYHNFSRTLAEHNRNAAQYQRELNRRKIFR